MMDQEHTECTRMEYPTKFNKYRRLLERQALSESTLNERTTLHNDAPATFNTVTTKSAMTSELTMTSGDTVSACSSAFSRGPLHLESNAKFAPKSSNSNTAVAAAATDASKYASTSFSIENSDLMDFMCQSVSVSSHFRDEKVTERGKEEQKKGTAMQKVKEEDFDEMPLNLTISAAGKEKRLNQWPTNNSSPTTISDHALQRDVTGLLDNEIIEEHFQRSLGNCYSKLFDRSSSVSPPQQFLPSSPVSNVSSVCSTSRGCEKTSVSGSVDDHFSKSLGNVWKKVKEGHLPNNFDLLPNSVDDHFAKALGDTWYRIKAEKDAATSAFSSTSAQLLTDPTTSSPSTSFVQS